MKRKKRKKRKTKRKRRDEVDHVERDGVLQEKKDSGGVPEAWTKAQTS